jgi:alkanesulfonate monooxygenase SsuD/methylene tetrahydromethanopterin reductase-like flavin-dependent oxidoreductase (luciferase family)
MLQLAGNAEKWGYDFLWVPDHLTDIPPATSIYDAWTVLAYIGARTDKAMLGSGVTDIQRMHPAKTAGTVATLDNLTRGRAILGIGAGEVMNTKPYGIEWESAGKRIERLREYIEVVQTLWRSSYEHQVGFDGRFYQFQEAHLGLSPFRTPAPPVYVGAFSSRQLLEITGELAQGWYPGAFYTPGAFAEKVAVIRESATRAGRQANEIDCVANVPTLFRDDREAMDLARNSLKRGLVINRYMLKILGEEEAYDYVSKTLLYQLIAPTPAYAKILEDAVRSLPVSDESLDRGVENMMAVGTPSQCIEKIDRFIKAGATHITVGPVEKEDETLSTFARQVIPALRSRG